MQRESWSETSHGSGGTDPFPALRGALAPEYANLPPEDVEALVEQLDLGVGAEALENFFKSVGKVAQSALPGVVSGATAGAAL
ncbi:MAG TPA: hypothetical protein VJP77_09200, partial [Planctomycetota bacterium]|nr:hypothetical protein [Planctomycetota bacterium]